MRVSQTPVSLERPVGDEDGSELGELLADESAPEPFEVASEQPAARGRRAGTRARWRPASARSSSCASACRGTEPLTLEQVGAELGVTRERIRQIEMGTLKKLQVLPEAQPLRVHA